MTIKRAAALLFLLVMPLGRPVSADDAGDRARNELFAAVSSSLKDALKGDIGAKDKGYANFLLAAYTADPAYRDAAEGIFKKIEPPESAVYLGAIETLKARDFGGGGLIQWIVNVTPAGFVRLYHSYKGIGIMDRAVTDNPENLEIRIARANVYYSMPKFFGKFDTGYDDINTVLALMENGKAPIPACEKLFRDKSSVYFMAGLYAMEKGDLAKSLEIFGKSARSCESSPFAITARKIVESNPGK
ncbi:MAG: hypothetical protein HZB29_11800 [Nitrospinae bacterium]|nr:hypothetical protein [Nitrospinota bacterium]